MEQFNCATVTFLVVCFLSSGSLEANPKVLHTAVIMKLYSCGCITLLLLLHALLSAGYTALPRAVPAIALVAYNIYIQGGSVTQGVNIFDAPASNDLLILPIDQPFELANPPWAPNTGETLTNSPSLTEHCGGIGGYNNSLMFIVGGYYTQGTTKADTNFVWSYDTVNNVFSTPLQIGGSLPGVVDSGTVVTRISDGTLWLFGGENQPDNAPIIYNTTWRLTTYPGLSWTPVGSAAPHGGRQAHSASILSDGRMVILGGWNPAGNIVPLSTVDVFNTNTAEWTTYTAALQNTSPVARGSQAAVVSKCVFVYLSSKLLLKSGPNLSYPAIAHDDKIVIHGGDTDQTVPLGDVAVLDMTQASLQWTVPQINGTAPAPRFSHATAMVGTVMMLFFGLISNDTMDNGVYALDTATWSWLTTYTPDNLQYTKNWLIPPNNTVSSSSTTQTTQSSNSPAQNSTTSVPSDLGSVPLAPIIGGTAGGLVVIAAGLAGFIFCYRRGQRQTGPNGNRPQPAAPYPAQRFPGPDPAAPRQPQTQQPQYMQNMQGPPPTPFHQTGLPPYYRAKELDMRRDSADFYQAAPPLALPLRPLSQTSSYHGTGDVERTGDVDRQPSVYYKPDDPIFR
ncbi:hypothetical protein BC937DRAFT_91576 [Endogone sp. FLAS-F59071]|nr:hypothetical protein BC937DRAFT_91576 [Endogone sp. FLAS-F59071]|eukprot:RUS21736.1 hypothetical protein BC937DRAFT_91576 [Endogone sp. FLAS-F59071]